MINPDGQQSHNYEFVSCVATDEQLHHLTTGATNLRLELRRNDPHFQDGWRRMTDELNGMAAHTSEPRTIKYWQKTYNTLLGSVQLRLHRLRMCEQDSSIAAADRDPIVETLNASWKPWERWLIDRLPAMLACGAIYNVRSDAKRIGDEQAAVLLMVMHRWPELRPKPSRDELHDDEEESMDTFPAGSDSQRWLQLISVLNILGAKRSPTEWQKYVYNIRDELLAKISVKPEPDADAQAAWPALQRGLAQLLWPDRFGAFKPVVNPKPSKKSTFRRYVESVPNRSESSTCIWHTKFSRPERPVQVQIDLIAHHLKHNPAMWHAVVEPTKPAPTTPAWLLLVDILNTVGSRCESDAWHQFVCKAVHAARTLRRFEMTWFELQLAELWNGGAAGAQAVSSVDQLVCADVFRTDSGQLWYFCRLCNGEFAGETPFAWHCRDLHGLDVYGRPGDERVLTPVPTEAEAEAAQTEMAMVDECKHMDATLQEANAIAEPMVCKRESADELRPPEQPLFVDVLAHDPIEVKQEVMEYDDDDDDTAAIDVKVEPTFVDVSMAELDADGGHTEFTWRNIDAKPEPARAELAESTPMTPTGKPRRPKSAKALATEAAKAAARAAKWAARAARWASKATVVDAKPARHRKTFTCDMCRKQFHVKQDLVQHIKMHIQMLDMTGSADIDERLAGIRFPHSRCAECDQTFASRKARDAHVNAEHMLPLDPGLANAYTFIEDANAPGALPPHGYDCPDCSTKFERQCDLRVHYLQDHGIDSMIRFDEQHGHLIDASIKRPALGAHYRCNLCPFARVKRAEMNKHMWTHNRVASFLCSRCPFRTKSRSKLTHHRRVAHRDQLPTLACQYCDFKATERFMLERHRRLHTGELPFVCTVVDCRRAFRLMKSLRNHFMQRHYVGPPAFKCRMCAEMLNSQSQRIRHMRKQHPEVPLRVKFRDRKTLESTSAAKATAAVAAGTTGAELNG